MRYGSVCSGIEAASCAWRPLGWEASFVSEIDRHASAVLRQHYPHVPNLGDFTTIEANESNGIDLLVGGTPCQAFSVAGLRGGLDDERGNLTLEFVKLADRLQPTWIVWENVPGVLSIDDGRAFGSFLGGLAELGYGFAYRVLDAQHFGVPQRRRRVFVVGHLGDWRRAAAVLFERESLSGHPPPSREKGKGHSPDLAPSLRAQSQASHRLDSDAYVASTGDVSHCLNAGGMGRQDFETETLIAYQCHGSNVGPMGTLRAGNGSTGGGVPFCVTGDRTHALKAEGADGSEDGTGRGTPIVAFDWQSGGDARGLDPKDTAQLQSCQVPAVLQPKRSYQGDRIIPEDEVWPTLPAQPANNGGGPGGILHERAAMAVRRLTPLECERLMGFPDDWTKHGDYDDGKGRVPISDSQRYKMLGNSMAVPVMRWLGERIQLIDDLAERIAA